MENGLNSFSHKGRFLKILVYPQYTSIISEKLNTNFQLEGKLQKYSCSLFAEIIMLNIVMSAKIQLNYLFIC